MRLPPSTWILAACIALLAVANVALEVQVRAVSATIEHDAAGQQPDLQPQHAPPADHGIEEAAEPVSSAAGSV